ncbi:MAG: ABC transporter substrate-binding protein [Bacteroidetes bacterium]|nr:ABC transporter substrate-binding protein [Bacteroidota bacterium]
MRIISLVPSQTELLYTLGLEDEVVGITKFCIHPTSWFRTKTRVGGTKNVHAEIIDTLKPDLILANKEENDRQQVEDLATRYPVWVSDVHTLSDALDMIRTVGSLTSRVQPAEDLASEIQRRFAAITLPSSPSRTAYLIWRDPYMAAAGDTFIHDMLQYCGYNNLFASQTRYPATSLEALADSGCETLLLSSEPYPFSEKHIPEIQQLLPNTHIQLVDGQLFSWYGSRLLEAPAYFASLRQQALKYP